VATLREAIAGADEAIADLPGYGRP
jgi:hypothetical protein